MDEAPIACSLTASDLPARLDEWRTLLSSVVDRQSIDGGVRLRFGPGVRGSVVADLAARELECCPFFTFGVILSNGGVALEVRAPEGAEAFVGALLGEAAAAETCKCTASPR